MDSRRARVAGCSSVSLGTPSPDSSPPSSVWRQRLKGRTTNPVRPSKKFDGWQPWPLGAIFLAGGVLLIILATGGIPLNPLNFQIPPWMLCVTGSLFFLCGLLVWFGAVAAQRRRARLAKWAAAHPDEPVMADFRWDPAGASMPRWDEFRKAILGTAFLAIFLLGFDWWVLFFDESPGLVKVLVGFSNIILLAVVCGTTATLIRAYKFSPGRVTWKQFPMHPGEPLELTWSAPAEDREGWSSGVFILRCVEGYREENNLPVQDELWSKKIEVGPSEPGVPLPLKFHPPSDVPGTCMAARRPLFWELDLELETPGLNRKERILIPIYGKEFDRVSPRRG